MFKVLAIFLIFCICISCATIAKNTQFFNIDKDVLTSIVIFNKGSDRHSAVHGTGVLLDVYPEGDFLYIVTNRHLLNNREKISCTFHIIAELNDSSGIAYVNKDIELLLEKNKGTFFFIPTSNDSDFAYFKIPRAIDENLKGIKIDQIIKVKQLPLGNDLYFYGYPDYNKYDLTVVKERIPFVRKGILSYIATEDIDIQKKDKLIKNMFILDGFSIGGSSGSPIFAKIPTGKIGRGLETKNHFYGIVSSHEDRMNPLIHNKNEYKEEFYKFLSDKIDSIWYNFDDTALSNNLFESLRLFSEFMYSSENANLVYCISTDVLLEYINHNESK